MVHKPSEEEKYFQEREIERRKEKQFQAELEEARAKDVEAVSKELGISDKELAEHLVDLGFGAQTAPVFPLIPLVYVAWADGDVSEGERSRILEIAETRGLKPETEAYTFLTDLLERRPADSFLEISVKAIRRIYELMPDSESDAAKTDLVSLSLEIAGASGGFLGVFGNKVSDSERAIIKDIVGELGLDKSSQASDLLKKLK